MAGELDRLVNQFAQQRRLNSPRHDGQDRYFMLVDDDIEIALFQSGESIYLEGQLEAIPADRQQAEDLLERTLRLHLARLQEHQEVICIDSQENSLVLFRLLPARLLRLADLEKALEAFVNALEFWTGEISQPPARTLAPPPQMRMLFP
jgi:hypothetical protein